MIVNDASCLLPTQGQERAPGFAVRLPQIFYGLLGAAPIDPRPA